MKKACSHCGHQVESTEGICPRCGTILISEPSASQGVSQEQENRIVDLLVERLAGHKKITRQISWSVLKWVVGTLGILGVLFGFSIWDSMRTIIHDTNFRLERTDLSISNQIAKAHAQITNQIAKQFESPRIKETIIEVAATQATNLLTEQIQPEIRTFSAGTSNTLIGFQTSLEAFQKESTDALSEVGGVLALTRDMIAAVNDDRFAFDRLVKLSQSGTNEYGYEIAETINTITTQQQEDNTPLFSQVNELDWAALSFNPDTNSWNDYMSLYSKVGQSLAQSEILKKLSQQIRFPRDAKLWLYHYLLEGTPSVRVLAATCSILDEDAHMKLNVLGESRYLAWLNSEIRKETITNCTTFIMTNQSNADIYGVRAACYYDETNFVGAITDIRKALTLDPSNTGLMNNSAWFLATCPSDLFRNAQNALRYAKTACQMTQWKNANFLGTLAAAYAETGDFDQAVKFEKKAIGAAGISNQHLDFDNTLLKMYQARRSYRGIFPGDPY
jgi:tetratricopeptide (TPR) repeat protein